MNVLYCHLRDSRIQWHQVTVFRSKIRNYNQRKIKLKQQTCRIDNEISVLKAFTYEILLLLDELIVM